MKSKSMMMPFHAGKADGITNQQQPRDGRQIKQSGSISINQRNTITQNNKGGDGFKTDSSLESFDIEDKDALLHLAIPFAQHLEAQNQNEQEPKKKESLIDLIFVELAVIG